MVPDAVAADGPQREYRQQLFPSAAIELYTFDRHVMTRHNKSLPGPHDAIALQNVDGQTIQAGDLWKNRPVLIICLRRLGCSMFPALIFVNHVRITLGHTHGSDPSCCCSPVSSSSQEAVGRQGCIRETWNTHGMRCASIASNRVRGALSSSSQILALTTEYRCCLAQQHQALKTSDTIYKQQSIVMQHFAGVQASLLGW